MLTKEIAEEAVEILANEGHEASVYEAYSGRGMFGSTCVGIVTGVSGALVGWAICCAVLKREYEESVGAANEFESINEFALLEIPTRSDSMGRDTIYY